MAGIRLASAIGEQRRPIDVLGGLDDAINKAGDAIQAEQVRKAEAAAKKKDQEQKYKDAIAATIEVTPPDRAFPEQKQEYETFAKRGVAELLAMSADPNKTPSEIKKKKDEIEYGLKDRLNVYREAYDAFEGVEKKRKDYDTGNFEAWFGGKTNPTQVAQMPNDDFMAASEADRAGKMVGENGMQATETETSFQGKPYLNMTFEEQKAIPFRNKANELITLKKPNIVKAAQGYLGSDFKFGSLTKRTDKVSPTSGEYIYEFDEKGADELARKFASSVVGDGNFGSKEHSQYQRALEYEALRAGNEAGFSGDKLKEFVQDAVPRMAYDDFMRDARAAEAERSKNEKDITKQPSKGLEINFTSGGGGSSNIWNISEGIEAPLYESKDGKKTDKVIGDYYYHAIQTKAAGENPKKFNIAGYTDVQVEGINVNKKTGKPEYIDITIPARYDKYDELIPNTGIKKTVRITEQTEIDNLRTNLGSKLYDGTIGSHKPTKEDAKAAPKKEAAIPTIKSEAEFNKLPKGTKFYNSKGVLKTKG
jgi:hypothetical protein